MTAAGAPAAVVEAEDTRPPVEVAVGVLIRADGAFLLTSRPTGKVYAGYWEFPGGKVEPGESIEAALARELHEELGLGLDPGAMTCVRWRVELMSYPHARVRLNFCKVFAWQGEPAPHEGQQLAWQQLPVDVAPLLPGTLPVLAWFAHERGHVGATHGVPRVAP